MKADVRKRQKILLKIKNEIFFLKKAICDIAILNLCAPNNIALKIHKTKIERIEIRIIQS